MMENHNYYDVWQDEIKASLDKSRKIGYALGTLRTIKMLLAGEYYRCKVLSTIDEALKELTREVNDNGNTNL